LKRRQLAHGARNRAGQLIVGQVPAIDEPTERWSDNRKQHKRITIVAFKLTMQ
jgi:hypothetical protein